ncbi:MAG: hypothetical protein JNL32_15040 [Candidatus Kapabacteria bacterium]|nr:hypothetical protein [Candidatus Kapabacteria bacterium]
MLSFITRPIVAFPTVIAVCFAGWFAYTSLKSTTDHEHNFYSDSMRNYDAILGGAIKVQYSTGNFDSLTKFFKNSGIDYELVHPYINAELVGGVVSDEHGKKLAHMVYKKDGKLIYMYEVPEELFATHAMHVPAHVQPYAESGKWYSSVDPEHHHSWMFWRVKTTYCSVVSDLSKEQLADLFVKGV